MNGLVNILRAAGEPTRLRILAVLARGELTVSELTQVLGQSQPRISRHLKLMVDAGLLERKPEGSWAFYRLTRPREPARGRKDERAQFGILLAGMVSPEDPAFARDLERLESVKSARAHAAEAYFRDNARRWNSLRSLHVSEELVERTILELVGTGPFNHMVDVGTGTGRMLELLGPRIRRGTGIDINHEMLTLARTVLDKPRLQHCQVQYGDIFSLPFAGDTVSAQDRIDLVLIHQVLHYLADPSAVVGEAARILAPEGSLLVVDFAPHGIEALRTEHAHRRLGFAEEEVRGFMKSAGLDVDVVRHLPADAGQNEERLTVTIWRARQKRSTIGKTLAAAS